MVRFSDFVNRGLTLERRQRKVDAMPEPPTLDELIGYVHTLQPEDDALARLREAMLIAQRLNEHADHLIGHFVDQARRSGASWTAIGESMGVTKQAAQKRFVPGAQDEPRAAVFQRFTPRARRAIANAREEAGKLGSAQTGTEHLLLGLAGDGKGIAARVLKAQGVTEDRVRLAVTAAAPSGEAPRDEVPFSPRAKKAIQLAVREALQLGHDYVGTEHLLLALFTEGEGVAADVLRELGVSEEAVRRSVAELLRDAA
jgi:hypothetical protein